MNKKYITLFFFIFSAFDLFAQPDSLNLISFPLTIDSIYVTGNDITDGYIITRELTFEKGDTVNSEILNYNKERIFSLGLFSKVELNIEKRGNSNFLKINVEETWYVYPVPFAELKDKNWNKISYGVYLIWKNFRGKNETISSKISFGYDPSYSLTYYMPEIVQRSNIYFSITSSYTTSANISKTAEYLNGGYQFKQKMLLNQLVVGKRINLFHWLSINLNYNYIETPFYIKGVSASDERIDRFPSAGINYAYDTRDLVQFPKNGMYFGTSYQWKGWGINDINYSIFSLDFREYRPIAGDLYGKWRFASRIGIGREIPFYDYSYIGLAERIRGFYKEQQEGYNFYLGSLEFYYPVIKDYQLNFDWVPLLPNKLLRYRVALYSQLFTDTGAIQGKKSKLSLNDFNTGFGAGLTLLILPYNSLRFEVALNEQYKSQFIFDLGISF